MTSDPAPWRVIGPATGAPPSVDPISDPRAADDSLGRLVLPVVVGAAAGLVVVAIGMTLLGSGPVGTGIEVAAGERGDGATVAVEASEAAGTDLVVAVAGAVQRPGVVELPPGSRVGDAIAAAGGYGPSIDAARAAIELNLAAPLVDGEQIVVPVRGATEPGQADGSGAGDDPAAGPAGGLVDLNRATTDQLDALPGVGPATIAKILAAREERPFATLDELVERKVLGPATLEKIRDLAVVR